MKESLWNIKKSFLEITKGFLLIFKSIFLKINYNKINLPVNIFISIIILALIGLFRTLVSILLKISFHGGVWFSFDLGVIFTMLVFPVFLCFFPAMILDFFFKSWKVNVDSRNILGMNFFIQFIHLFIPLFEWLQRNFNIPCSLSLVPQKLYLDFAISPLASTPLIFTITNACTLGISVAWFFATIVIIKYGLNCKVPVLKYLLVLMLIFYIIYVLTYPTYYLFYSYGNNFYYGMVYLLGSIGPILYFKSKKNLA